MKKEQVELSNNLRTIFVDNPGSTFATVQIWFAAGSALEEKGEEGIAHFLEHMFFKGTKTRPGAQIAHEVESFGGEINAFTSFDYTCYYINAPKTNILESTEILMDMVSNPMFKLSDIIPEREVVLEEYKRSLDTPNHYSFHCLQKKSFQGGYSHPILGNQKTIKNFSRQQLISFRKRFYNNKNAILMVAGDLGKIKTKLVNKIQSYKLPNGKQSTFPPFKLKNKPSIDIHTKDVELAQLSFAISAPENYSNSSSIIYSTLIFLAKMKDISTSFVPAKALCFSIAPHAYPFLLVNPTFPFILSIRIPNYFTSL